MKHRIKAFTAAVLCIVMLLGTFAAYAAETLSAASPAGAEVPAGAAAAMTDISAEQPLQCSEWAEPYIRQALEMGLIPESLQAADLTAAIDRQEFAQLSVLLYERLSGTPAPEPGDAVFTDCTDPAVCSAFQLGITDGNGNGSFSPKKLLTREQGAAMLTRVYKKIAIEGWALGIDEELRMDFIRSFRMSDGFADEYEFSSWARDSIHFMKARSILDGVGGGRFAPKGNMTREQALKIAVKMAEVIGNDDFAPMDARLIELRDDMSVYTWIADGMSYAALYDRDGVPADVFEQPAVTEDIWYPQVEKTKYDGWYAGLAGVFRLQDGRLQKISAAPAKDIFFIEGSETDGASAGNGGLVIMTWSDLSEVTGFGYPADTILRLLPDGAVQVMLGSGSGHGILMERFAADEQAAPEGFARVLFCSELPQGMGHYDIWLYELLISDPDADGVSEGPYLRVLDYTAGRPETCDGFDWDAPEAYKTEYIRTEQQRLRALGLGR